MATKHSMDLTRGSVPKNLLIFTIPILLSNLLCIVTIPLLAALM